MALAFATFSATVLQNMFLAPSPPASVGKRSVQVGGPDSPLSSWQEEERKRRQAGGAAAEDTIKVY